MYNTVFHLINYKLRFVNIIEGPNPIDEEIPHHHNDHRNSQRKILTYHLV